MYEFKELYLLDFSNINRLEVYDLIKSELDFPEYCGHNLDAVWDCLTDMVGESVNIKIIGFKEFEKRNSDFSQKFIKLLYDFKHCYDDGFYDKIKIEIVRGDESEFIV